MTTALKRTGAALLTLLMFCMLTLGASAAANTPVGVKFWKEKSDKESMANSGIDSDREAILTRQSNGTYTLTLPVKQVTKLNVTGCLTGLTIGDVTYTGTLTGEIRVGGGGAIAVDAMTGDTDGLGDGLALGRIGLAFGFLSRVGRKSGSKKDCHCR